MGLATQLIGRVFVVVHDASDPTSEEWAKFVATVRGLDVATLRCLVVTRGGKPNALQRRQLREVGGPHLHAIRAAIVSDNHIVRSVAFAFSCFVPNVRAMRESELAEALVFLDVPSYDTTRVEHAVTTLRNRLKGTPP